MKKKKKPQAPSTTEQKTAIQLTNGEIPPVPPQCLYQAMRLLQQHLKRIDSVNNVRGFLGNALYVEVQQRLESAGMPANFDW